MIRHLVLASFAVLGTGCASVRPAHAPPPTAVEVPHEVRAAPLRPSSTPASSSTSSVGEVVAGALILGAIGGAGVCWYKCPEPWDSAVPIGVGSATLVGLVVAFAIAAPSMGATK